jgi:hypothetical protein
VVDGDGEVEHVEELHLQLVHLRVAHAAHAREEGVAVVAARGAAGREKQISTAN